MAGVYLDTSALGHLVLDEPDADVIGSALTRFEVVVSSRLLRTELHRLGLRTGVPSDEIASWLTSLALVPVDEEILSAAESIGPASVATLDAIHLVTAIRLAASGHISSVMTFDVRLAEGAAQHQLEVIAPVGE
ncbi:MAG TPA: type II toxin-antitoxin system VapC family toxin [Solirubrobacterales bacterium]|nr:type II toxin-antitoxin system VapC family toxin [Solirubrobacterales bacterium]HMU26847.1 type II toxin-antitoxin system VapC family toxin [Solirubrobacterales bacterium]HMX70539.1 type II toxin-antitoxin system VapC family toxin [Solirubrobacterales bacterium]HMY25139.1 type II toxin-antitoxin system VapC family toxin [Solirubrobacterales bacterium]HNA23197.1 type II toxin-antitoxin system VapC family toxin [Solirubrobacterales bacterium]